MVFVEFRKKYAKGTVLNHVTSIVCNGAPLGNDERIRALLVLSHGLPAIISNHAESDLQTLASNARMICALLGWDRALQTLIDRLGGKLPGSQQETWFFCGKLYVRACCFVAVSKEVESQ